MPTEDTRPSKLTLKEAIFLDDDLRLLVMQRGYVQHMLSHAISHESDDFKQLLVCTLARAEWIVY